MEKALLSTHLSVGVGFYHHLILKLQLECGLDLAGIVDFAYPQQRHGLSDVSLMNSCTELSWGIILFWNLWNFAFFESKNIQKYCDIILEKSKQF